jgi:hypothetical protein
MRGCWESTEPAEASKPAIPNRNKNVRRVDVPNSLTNSGVSSFRFSSGGQISSDYVQSCLLLGNAGDKAKFTWINGVKSGCIRFLDCIRSRQYIQPMHLWHGPYARAAS